MYYIILSYSLYIHYIRSPWSNKYEPYIEDGFLPSEKLRNMEIEFNELFDAYRELYYEGNIYVYIYIVIHLIFVNAITSIYLFYSFTYIIIC